MSSPQTQVVLLLLVGLALTMAYPRRQESSGSYRLRPNTMKEFHYYNCQGEYNKNLYSVLNRICTDCQNIYRDHPNILRDCKANCFRTSMFPICVSSLELQELQGDYDRQISVISGDPAEVQE